MHSSKQAFNQLRTQGLRYTGPAVGKRATMKTSDWKSENTEHTRFPALHADYMYLLCVLIGSLDCICSLWLDKGKLCFGYNTQLKTAL